MVKIAINGLGRIGRCVFRAVFEEQIQDLEIVAVNGPAEIEQHIHLLQYDSVHGKFPYQISTDGQNIMVDGKKIPLLREKEIEQIDWSKYGNDVIVMECTGKFTKTEDLQRHIKSGGKKVILSAPSKTSDVKTVVFGVNHQILQSGDSIVSIGSCTTNCLAPFAKILSNSIGINKGFMTTIHSYTGDQNVVDGSHKSDMRRARACAVSMVPTSTGAAKAIGLVLPELNGKLDGSAIRVPTPNVSVVDLTFEPGCKTSVDQVNSLLKKASEDELYGILAFEEKPLVSVDFNHTKYSSVIDALETKVIGENMVRVLSWYDNEWAFSIRMLDIARYWNAL